MPVARCVARTFRPEYGLTLFRQMLVWIALLANPVFAQQSSLTEAQQTQVFDEAIHILGGNANVMSRWVGEIRFASIGDVSADVHDTALQTVTSVAEETGLPLVTLQHELVSDADYLNAVKDTAPQDLSVCDKNDGQRCANFVVLFAEAKVMRDLVKALPLRPLYQKAFDKTLDIACFFSPSVDGRMVIRQAFVYVRKDLTLPMLKTCIAEEVYQSFGLFNDYSDSEYFSFNNVVAPKQITSYDRALLRTVYDERHRPGSPVFVVVKELMNKLGYEEFNR